MNFLSRDVDQATYRLLNLLNISPSPTNTLDAVNRFKESIYWLVDREENEKITILAFSGEADPRLWNRIEGELMTALDQGLSYTHCLGPVVCTDENGHNSILQAFESFPKNVEIYLFRTRQLYHWCCFSRLFNEEPERIRYQLYGECFHNPLYSRRKKYCISLERNDDEFAKAKEAFWYDRMQNFSWLTPIMDKITSLDQISTLTFSQIKAVYRKMKAKGKNFNISTAEEIMSFANEI